MRYFDKSSTPIENLDESKKLLTGSSIVHQARLLLDTACLERTVGVRSDENFGFVYASGRFSEVVKSDPLLQQFGETLIKKYGPRRKNDIAQRLRQLARLLLKCRE